MALCRGADDRPEAKKKKKKKSEEALSPFFFKWSQLLAISSDDGWRPAVGHNASLSPSRQMFHYGRGEGARLRQLELSPLRWRFGQRATHAFVDYFLAFMTVQYDRAIIVGERRLKHRREGRNMEEMMKQRNAWQTANDSRRSPSNRRQDDDE